MMLRRAAIPSNLAIAVALVLSAPAFAGENAAWVVGATADSPNAMSRTVGDVAVDYHVVPGDYDLLKTTVERCNGGDSSWTMTDSLSTAKAEDLREALAQQLRNARLNCETLPDGLEERVLDGLDAAYDQFRPTLPPRVETVGGWTLEDKGSHPGDDYDRTLAMTKALPGIAMTYTPGANGGGASIHLDFSTCKGMDYSSGFDFSDGEDHAMAVATQVTEAYDDFTSDNKACKMPPSPQAALMSDFPQALATIEQWLADKPFVYPDYDETEDSDETIEEQ